MRGAPVDHPRKIGKHVAAIMDMIVDAGGEDLRVYKSRHIQIVFRAGDHELTVHTACTPRDEHHAIRYARNELMRDLEVRVPRVLAGGA